MSAVSDTLERRTPPHTSSSAVIVRAVVEVVATTRSTNAVCIPDDGYPVQFARFPDAGVPSAGVTSVGDVANTRPPEPVLSVTAVARLALVDVPRKSATPDANPVTPVDTGSPVQLVNTPAEGVPMSGVISVGLSWRTTTVVVPVADATSARSARFRTST